MIIGEKAGVVSAENALKEMIAVGTGRGMFVQDRRAVQTMDAADQVTTVPVIMDAADQVTTVIMDAAIEATIIRLLHDPTGVAAISTRI